MARTAFRIQTTQSIHAAPLVTVCEIQIQAPEAFRPLYALREMMRDQDHLLVSVLSNSGKAPRDRLIAVDAIVSAEVDAVWTERLATGTDRWVDPGHARRGATIEQEAV